ncbi:MAG: large conductance mechanosensitive channel protein [Piptocephalis tieghemiana]|nr:MAG: large conductance mechanosensitive channel protein [Piptocephalis tieghemiana]
MSYTPVDEVRFDRHGQPIFSSWWGDFKAFLSRGSVVELGVGVILGAAFGNVVSSFVEDIAGPPLGLLFQGRNLADMFVVLKHGKTPGLRYITLADAQADGAITENYGRFAQHSLNFVVISFAIFIAIRGISALRRSKAVKERDAAEYKECGECFAKMELKARRCRFCTSYVGAPEDD